MAINTHQTAFVSGELDPTMWGRESLTPYANGAEKIRNCYVRPQGSVPRREGLQFIDRVSQNARGRTISFEFNTVQVYLIVLTPGELKVYKNDTLVCTVNSTPISGLTANILETINWTQSADTLILFHPTIQPIKVTRTSDSNWTANKITFANVLTFDFGSGLEPMVSDARGWFRSAAFKYGRLWLGGLGSRPQTLIGSKVGDYFNLDSGTGLDDEAIYITLDDDRVNSIVNLFPGRALQIFTTGGEFAIQTTLDDPVTPGKIPNQLKKATLHGCNLARPVSVDGSTLFVEGSGAVVRQFVYNDVESSYNAPNISLLASHLVVKPERMARRQATPGLAADYVFMVNGDGTLAVLNVLRDESLLAWSLFDTQGYFEDVAVVGQEVYFLVLRQVAGNWVRFVEKFNAQLKTDAAVSVSSSVQVQGPPWVTLTSPQTAWSGFAHLNGMTVKVFGDDYLLNDTVVSNGTLTSSESVQALEVGLPFLAYVELLPAVIAIGLRTWAGEYKRLAWVNMRIINSRGVVVRQKNGKTYKSAWRQFGAAVLNVPVSLFTGWKKVFLGGSDRETTVVITQDDPLEFHLQAVVLGVGV